MNPVFLLASLICISVSTNAQTQKSTSAKKAIICLTYDDALETQISTALPQLDSVGLKATFFLTSIQGSSQSYIIGQTPEAVLGWTNAALNGHELANHTLFHPCPEAIGWDKGLAIESYNINKILTEVTTQNAILSLLDPSRKARAFAFPCGNFLMRDTDYVKIIQEKKLVTYARAGGDSNSVVTDFKHLDPMRVPSWHVWTGTTIQELIRFAEKVKKSGGMGVYQFHGIGAQVFQISAETHRAFLKYLKEHENDYLVLKFSEAMEFISKNN